MNMSAYIHFKSKVVPLTFCLITVLCSGAEGSTVAAYTVTLNTAPLVGHPAGPFSILIALTDGSGLGDGNNTIQITNVDFGGGSGSGGAGLFGGATGSLETGVTMNDSAPLSLLTESFSPGQTLRFTVSVTTGDDVGEIPDGMSFYILDNSGLPIPTLAPGAALLFAIEASSSPAPPETFGTDSSRSPSTGSPISVEAPVITSDITPPVTTATVSPRPNGNGWSNTNVTVTPISTDNEPGGTGVKQINYSATGAQTIASTVVAGGSTSFTINTEGTTTITFFGTDNAGNVETAKTLTIKLDKTPPTISGAATPAANANGWNNTNVTVSFTCSDSLSGLTVGSPPVLTTLSAEGAGQSVTGTCTDLAGNSASSTVTGINIDKTPPVLACSASPNVLWPPNNKLVPINVSVNVTDSLSGSAGFTLVSVTSNEAESGQRDIQGFVTGTASTSGQLRAQRLGSGTGRVYTFAYSGADRAGNTATCITTVTVPHDQGQN
jgi:hypothetical protein